MSLLPGAPTSLSGAPGMPPAPYSTIHTMQRRAERRSAAFQPMTGMQWPQPTPYESPFASILANVHA